eukprot:m.173404 g.173404  ORF g.173404 m.173404 type:complete len:372 (+) comp13502_c1_seq21:1094-2209(+)
MNGCNNLTELHQQMWLSFKIFKTRCETMVLRHENYVRECDLVETKKTTAPLVDRTIRDIKVAVNTSVNSYQEAMARLETARAQLYSLVRKYDAIYAPNTSAPQTLFPAHKWQWVTYPDKPVPDTGSRHGSHSSYPPKSSSSLSLSSGERHFQFVRECSDLSAIATTLRRQVELYRLAKFRELFRSTKRDIVYVQPLQELQERLEALKKRYEKREKKEEPKSFFGGGFDLSLLTDKLAKVAEKQNKKNGDIGEERSPQHDADLSSTSSSSSSRMLLQETPQASLAASVAYDDTDDSKLSIPQLVDKIQSIRQELAYREAEFIPSKKKVWGLAKHRLVCVSCVNDCVLVRSRPNNFLLKFRTTMLRMMVNMRD